MSSSKARMQAIEAVKKYEPPAAIFEMSEKPGEVFGQNVFTKAVMQAAAAQGGVQVADGHDRALQAARSDRRRRGGRGDEGLGHGEGRHPLRPRLLPADPSDRGEARQLPRAGRRRRVDRRVRRQDADPGRAGRVELPERRPAQHLRSPRLHRLGRHQPRLHPREPQRQHPLHPDRVHLDDRRGPRPQDAAAALAAGHGRPGRAGAAPVRPRQPRRGGLVRRRRAGVLPDRPELLPRPPRPAQRRAAPSSGPRRPRARSSTTTTSAPFPSGCWPSCSTASGSCSSWASRPRPATTRWPRASSRSPRCSSAPTWPPTTSSCS